MDAHTQQDAASFEQLFQSSTEGIFIHHDLQLLAANDQLMAMLGYDRADQLPAHILEPLPSGAAGIDR